MQTCKTEIIIQDHCRFLPLVLSECYLRLSQFEMGYPVLLRSITSITQILGCSGCLQDQFRLQMSATPLGANQELWARPPTTPTAYLSILRILGRS